MNFDLTAFLNQTNPVIPAAIAQPSPDGLMSHGLSLVGIEGQAALRDALRDQSQLPDTYLAIYVASKDDLDDAGQSFNEEFAMSLVPFKYGGNLLVHKATYVELERYQYKELIVDGLLSGKDYYYGIKMFVAGEAQIGFNKGAFTTHGTAYSAPIIESLVLVTPSDDYKLKYNILEHDMSGITGLVPRFEVVNRVLTDAAPNTVFINRDVYDPATPSYFILEDVAGGIFHRYVEFDVQVRYLSKDGNPVGISPPTIIATGVQIPWLHNFVDEVILKGGGIDQQILEDAATSVASLTPAERDEMLAQLADGDIRDIGTAYVQLLKKSALETISALESQANAMRATLRILLYDALAAQEQGKGLYTTLDLGASDAARVFSMVTAPSDLRGYHIKEFVKFAEGVFNVMPDVDVDGEETGLTRLTYVGHAAFERFFIDFNNRTA
jgi:hypothetical protein